MEFAGDDLQDAIEEFPELIGAIDLRDREVWIDGDFLDFRPGAFSGGGPERGGGDIGGVAQFGTGFPRTIAIEDLRDEHRDGGEDQPVETPAPFGEPEDSRSAKKEVGEDPKEGSEDECRARSHGLGVSCWGARRK